MTIQVVVMLLLLIKARNPAAAVQLKLTVDTPTRREFFRRTSKVSSREETTSDHETVTFPAGSEDTDTADSHQFVITTSPELFILVWRWVRLTTTGGGGRSGEEFLVTLLWL